MAWFVAVIGEIFVVIGCAMGLSAGGGSSCVLCCGALQHSTQALRIMGGEMGLGGEMVYAATFTAAPVESR